MEILKWGFNKIIILFEYTTDMIVSYEGHVQYQYKAQMHIIYIYIDIERWKTQNRKIPCNWIPNNSTVQWPAPFTNMDQF